MITHKMLKETADHLKTNEYDYAYVAMRVVSEDYDDYNAQIGDTLPESYVWDDGEWTSEKLNGTCGIYIKARIAPVTYSGYSGDRILVIAGDNAEGGQDDGEIIIQNAKVIQIINFK